MTSRVDPFLRSSSDFYDGVFSITKKQEKVGRVGQIVWLVKTEQKGHVIEDGLSSKIPDYVVAPEGKGGLRGAPSGCTGR